jgi:hypothetical protein
MKKGEEMLRELGRERQKEKYRQRQRRRRTERVKLCLKKASFINLMI